jgi:flagellar M-ring protein FliF
MGHVLSAPGVDGGVDTATSLRDQQTYAYEQRVSAAVQTLLQPLVGAGHVIVQVSANLNFDAQDTTSESYVQPSAGATPIPLSQTKSIEIYSGSGQVSAGILGPDNIAMPPVTATASPGSYASQSSTTDNAIGRVVQQVKTAPGAVERLSVAVLLDSNVAAKVDAAAVQSLVTNAAGVQTTRGDSVQVSSMAFDTTATKATQKALAAAASKKSMGTLMGYAKDAVIGLIVLGVIFFLMRRAKKAAERSPILSTSERLELDEAHRMLAISAAQTESARVPALVGGPRGQDGIEGRRPAFDNEIGDLVERQPEEVAQLLRGWLADRRGA